jgi:hypothetical protein
LNYLVKITRPDGCVSTDTVFVTLNGIPSVEVEDTTLCHGNPLQIHFTDNTNPSNSTTFSWTVTDDANLGFPSSGNDDINIAQLTNLTSSAVTATITVTPTKNGCTGVDTAFKVTVYGKLSAGTIGPSQQPQCYGTTLSIDWGSDPATGGSSQYDYQWESSFDSNAWSPLSGVIDQQYQFSPTVTQTMYYRRSVTDVFCNITEQSDAVKITVKPLPTISAGTTDLCIRNTTPLYPNAGGVWTSDDPSIVEIVNNELAAGKAAGKAKLSYQDAMGGCSDNIEITVYDFPDVEETSGKAVICPGEVIVLTNSTLQGGVWKKNNDNISFESSTANSVNVKGVTSGKTFVSYTVSNPGCETTKTFRLKVGSNTPPKIIIGFER